MKLVIYINLIAMLVSCNISHSDKIYVCEEEKLPETLVERIDSCNLLLLFPSFNSIDLICETMPSANDSSVILCAEACFTGQCLKEFNHFNIAGDHVSKGIRYHGYKCKRNTGAFVYYNNQWKFLLEDYDSELDKAADNAGAAFAQEMIIHNGLLVNTIRKDSNKNQFRALCEIDGKLCIVESKIVMSFGTFKQKLIDINVSEALYLDMGGGRNHAWYRTNADSITVLHPKTHNYCTNWITFFK